MVLDEVVGEWLNRPAQCIDSLLHFARQAWLAWCHNRPGLWRVVLTRLLLPGYGEGMGLVPQVVETRGLGPMRTEWLPAKPACLREIRFCGRWCGGCRVLLGEAAENVAHHAQQFERTGVTHPIKYAVGVLAGAQDAFVAQDGQML